MNKGVLNNRVWIPAGAALATCLSGCSKLDVLDPKGSIGVAEKSLIGTATFTMLIVVVPVILMTLWFAWRYRASQPSRDVRAEMGALHGNRSGHLDGAVHHHPVSSGC